MPSIPIYQTLRRRLASVLAGFAAFVAGSSAHAGGGPENLFLVVNARSWSSLTVANHYVRLRKIPLTNVYFLDWSGDNERIDAETMRTKLLGPILEEIERRGIHDHIDYVVYSTDFPWAVDCAAELKGLKPSQYLTPVASLNGATFLYQNFLARRYDFLLLDANRYHRAVPKFGAPTTQAFRSWYGWGGDGALLEAGGEHYLLSAMLGVTAGRGSATADVVRYLTRSVGADFTRPAGTIYYARNDDVRSKTRHESYQPAVDALRLLDVRAEVVDARVPQGKTDVQGAMLGTEQFSWRDSHSVVRAGAVCEHLTSTGGVLSEGAGQTSLIESLAAGAAASSGAVTEPFAIPQKFPNPFLHVHYARGCSLAEAFYQSVHGPYQLLIVGDPLCRPWADPPRVAVEGIEADAVVGGERTLAVSAKFPPHTYAARYELYVDGRLTAACDGEANALRLDTRTLTDGYHELRVMAVGGEPIETRGGRLLPITVDNHGRRIELHRVGDGPVRWGEPLRLKVAAPGARGMIIAQGNRTLARLNGGEGEVLLEPRMLGLGPVTLQAAAVGDGGPETNAVSQPLEFEVATGEPLASYTIAGGARYAPGMKFTQASGEPAVVNTIAAEKWLEELGVKADEPFTLVGFLTVDRDGEFQFHLRHTLRLELAVDEQKIYAAENREPTVDYVPVALRRGLHKFELRGRATSDAPRLDVRFGYQGVQRLKPAAMTHIP